MLSKRLLPGLRVGAIGLTFLTTAALPALAQDDPFSVPVKIGFLLPDVPADADTLQQAVARQYQEGETMATEEFTYNAQMLDIDFQVLTETATGADAAVAAAQDLVNQGAYGIVGGYSAEEAEALGQWAAQNGIPFLNIGAQDDVLRNSACQVTTYHLVPSDAMYLDALAGWYVRAGFRNWYVIQEDSDHGNALHTRLGASITTGHFAVREVGDSAVAAGGAITPDIVANIRSSGADLVVLLMDAEDQVTALGQLEQAGVTLEVAGMPEPASQTRTFFEAARTAAPTLGAQHRATGWEATLDNYGAREMNARFRDRWSEPMDEPGWAAYQGIKIMYESVYFGQVVTPAGSINYFNDPNSVFDVYKGVGTSFREWDRQLRQSLFLDQIDPTNPDSFSMALLVGELPAIYLPGTELDERLDQLGDLQATTTCASPSPAPTTPALPG